MTTIQKKICLLGGFAVGKTSLIRQFTEGNFNDKYLSTIGVKISRKPLQRPDHTLNFIIWDLAGGDDFTKRSTSYLRGAVGAIIVCDLTRPNTLDYLPKYLEQLQAVNPNILIVLACNKADLVAERAISDDELKTAVSQINSPHLLTSAKTGENVEAIFELLADRIESGQ